MIEIFHGNSTKTHYKITTGIILIPNATALWRKHFEIQQIANMCLVQNYYICTRVITNCKNFPLSSAPIPMAAKMFVFLLVLDC